jgi:hypothetical protein
MSRGPFRFCTIDRASSNAILEAIERAERVRTAILVTLAAILAALPSYARGPQDTLEVARSASVGVRAGDGVGSGVLFKNGQTTFVWTAAHVLPEVRASRTFIDPATGKPKVEVVFNDAWVVSEVVEDGRKVGEDRRLARVVRYDEEEDVALLMVRQAGFGRAGVKFAAVVPKVGSDVIHVGGFRGPRGAESVSTGVVAAVGRLRRDGAPTDVRRPLVSDQFSVVAQKGSSGGGVFSKDSGECLGLVNEFLEAGKDGYTHGAVCTVPARRIREYAERVGVKCAVEPDARIPEGLFTGPINTSPIELPMEWRVPEFEAVPASPFPTVFEKFGVFLVPKKS